MSGEPIVSDSSHSAENLSSVLNAAPFGVLVWRDSEVLFENPAFRALPGQPLAAGWVRPELLGVHADDRARVRAHIDKTRAGHGLTSAMELRVATPEGAPHWCRVFLRQVEWDGRPALMASFDSIDGVKLTEERLRQTEDRFAMLAEHAPLAVAEIHVNQNRFLAVNDAACAFTGYSREELVAIGPDGLMEPTMRTKRAAIVERVLKGQPLTGSEEFVLRAKDGRQVWVLVNATFNRLPDGNLRALVVAQDVTARKKVEEEMQRIERLESLGVLAGGIAHDFNNILTAVLGSVSLARLSPSVNDVDRLLAETEKACIRAKDLTQQLLTFSKGGAPVRRTSAIGRALKEWVAFALRGSNVQCRFEIADDLWSVRVDEGQMNQVIHNIVLNAEQAMPAGGTVTVSAKNQEIGGDNKLALTTGRYIVIKVQDHGVGIPPAHLAKIFDPFYTTKQGGSGLGLATAYSIAKRHDGIIRVESQPGVGSSFFIYLPASDAPVLTVEAKPVKLEGGTGAILLMDDDETIRRVGEQMLKRLGYEVVTSTDGANALALYRDRMHTEQPFAAVIMDLTVPGGLGGLETLKHLRVIDPRVRALVSSGYSTAPAVVDAAAHGFQGVVTKPFTIEDLDKALRRAGIGRRA